MQCNANEEEWKDKNVWKRRRTSQRCAVFDDEGMLKVERQRVPQSQLDCATEWSGGG